MRCTTGTRSRVRGRSQEVEIFDKNISPYRLSSMSIYPCRYTYKYVLAPDSHCLVCSYIQAPSPLPSCPSSSISGSFYLNPQKCSAILSACADFNSVCSADTRTGMCAPGLRRLDAQAPSDLGSYARSPKVQEFNPIHVTVPKRLPRRLDSSLPPSWSSSNSLCPADSGMRARVPWFLILMISMSSDVDAITHSDSYSYLLDLSLALQSCDPDIRYHEVDLPTVIGPGNANHEPTSELFMHISHRIADKIINVPRFRSSSILSAIRGPLASSSACSISDILVRKE